MNRNNTLNTRSSTRRLRGAGDSCNEGWCFGTGTKWNTESLSHSCMDEETQRNLFEAVTKYSKNRPNNQKGCGGSIRLADFMDLISMVNVVVKSSGASVYSTCFIYICSLLQATLEGDRHKHCDFIDVGFGSFYAALLALLHPYIITVGGCEMDLSQIMYAAALLKMVPQTRISVRLFFRSFLLIWYLLKIYV